MNFQNLNFDYVEQPLHLRQQFIPRTPRTPSEHSQLTVRPSNQQGGEQDYASSRPATPSPRPTVIPYAPTPPSPSGSGSEIYGPDRLFGPPLILTNNVFGQLRDKPLLTVDEIQQIALQTALAGQMHTGFCYKDAVALEAGKVTPGVDDTPYIQYALDALTKDRDTGYSQNASSSSGEPNPLHRYIPDHGLGYYKPETSQNPSRPEALKLRDERRTDDRRRHRPPRPLAAFDPHTPSPNSSLSTLVPQPKVVLPPHPKDAWQLQDYDRFSQYTRMMPNPQPDFKPPILRPFSMITLMTFCILMITALMFSAIWSRLHTGLVAYSGTIYGGQYFLFRILPQLLAAFIQLWAQSISVAVFRILPFARMEAITNSRPQQRYGALFQDLYPKSFLWPQLIGTWQIWVPILVTWLLNFALPLQSSLFTVIFVDGKWRWAAVEGVAWTLVVLYIALLMVTVFVFRYWRDRNTGLIWDPRSIADIIALVSSSNTLSSYRGTELMGTREELVGALHRRVIDQLGYWAWRDQRDHGIWHAIGTDLRDEAWLKRNVPNPQTTKGDKEQEGYDVDIEASPRSAHVRYRYLPWCMRNNQILYFIVTAFVLLVALFVVSFLPTTNIRKGFLPWVPAAPVAGAFSAADFLYSFLPSLLGLIMFLLFQSLELSLRILQPWAELAQHSRSPGGGALPEPSILADYAACLPLQSTLHALKNRHWRVAAMSLLSTAFILLPALSGGIFMTRALSNGEARMVPNVPLYAIVLTLLVLYFLALVAMLPGRKAFRLPHAVTCLAEIISFCANDDLSSDEAFKNVRYKTTLRGKIGVDRVPAQQPRWVFGFGTGGDERLGIRRVRRYTELEKRASRRARRQLMV